MGNRSRRSRTRTKAAVGAASTGGRAQESVQGPAGTRTRRLFSPVLLFALVATACLVLAVTYVTAAVLRNPSRAALVPTPSASGPGPGTASQAPEATSTASATPQIVFQNVERDEGYGQVAVVPIDNPGAPRALTGLTCERVHFAAGKGLCLVPEGGLVSTYSEITFDSSFQPIHRVALGGAPTRTRVSPDGRYGAATVFVFGHSYADANFSTQTTIIDMASGTPLGDLETFTTLRDDLPWASEDFNFWGVTFMPDDSNRFYATVRSSGQTHLVAGDIQARTMRVLRENVECPSLSPDGTRIAFKKLTEGLVGQWRLHVLDLATLAETPLAETRNIDDQVEWLDNESVLYGDGQDIWTVATDGSGPPRLFIAAALSPAVVR